MQGCSLRSPLTWLHLTHQPQALGWRRLSSVGGRLGLRLR